MQITKELIKARIAERFTPSPIEGIEGMEGLWVRRLRVGEATAYFEQMRGEGNDVKLQSASTLMYLALCHEDGTRIFEDAEEAADYCGDRLGDVLEAIVQVVFPSGETPTGNSPAPQPTSATS